MEGVALSLPGVVDADDLLTQSMPPLHSGRILGAPGGR